MRMLKIGKFAHIVADEVVAVSWYTYDDKSPVVYLQGGHAIPARLYSVEPERDPDGAITQPIDDDMRFSAVEALKLDIEAYRS